MRCKCPFQTAGNPAEPRSFLPVSYTHLDVYKRQELWIPHDFQRSSVKCDPTAAKIERNSRLFYIPVCVLLITHSTASPKGRTCPLDNHTASQQHLITCIRHDKGTLFLPFSQPASRSCQHPHGNIAVHTMEYRFLPMLLYRYAKCTGNVIRVCLLYTSRSLETPDR